MTRLDVERTELRDLIDGVRAETARSLDLLRAIESTLAWLERLTGTMSADAEYGEKVIAGLSDISGVIDTDGTICASLEEAQKGVEDLYNLLITKRQHARDDSQLTEDDGINGAYTEAIAAAADLHNIFNTLRWHIGEHDADASPRVTDATKVASTPDELDKIFDSLVSE